MTRQEAEKKEDTVVYLVGTCTAGHETNHVVGVGGADPGSSLEETAIKLLVNGKARCNKPLRESADGSITGYCNATIISAR